MTTIKRFLTLSLIAALAMQVWGERVSQEDAAAVANNFMNVSTSTSGARRAVAPKRMVLKTATAAQEENQYYVYENADGEGWVMVAANDVVKPILAYSETGTFRVDNMPSNVTHWLGHYNKFIKKLEDDSVTQTAEAAAQWRKLRKAPPSTAKGNIVVDMIIQTQWDQDAPYNNLTPGSGSNKSYTGCVATAMAQVMYFWKWPVTGNGSRTYQPKDPTSDSGATSQRYGQQSANFGSTTYDWANMKNKHYTSDNTVQKTAIATLMFHCGVATDMMYGNDADGGSATYTVNYGDWDWSDSEGECAQNALYNFFRYKKPTGYMRDGYKYGGTTYYTTWTDEAWTAMVKAELDQGRPIMYGGSGSGGGHSFICDGYDDQDYFHFNWGWSGSNDGWYTLSNLVPGSGGAGGGSYSFTDDQDVIIGIEPVQVGHNVKLNGTGCSLSADKVRVENGNNVVVTITPTDATYDYTSTTVKLGNTTISSSNYTLSADKQTLTINGNAITGDASNDLTITIVWTKNRYRYDMLGENCTAELSGMLAKNAPLNLTITPDAGYTLADAACWDVTMGGNALTYGTGFTYNPGTDTFAIATVTGDVEIVAYGLHPVAWRANGSPYATNLAVDGKITLPANPEDCSATKKFVGWCTISDYSHATTAPTFAKTGDTYSVSTFYAVYATPAPTSAPMRKTAAPAKASSIAVGDEVILVYESGNTKKEMTGFSTTSTVYGTVDDYSSTPAGTYTFEVVEGSSTGTFGLKHGSVYANWSSGNSLSSSSTLNANSSWSISFSSGNAIIANANTSGRTIRYNTSSPRFACYTSGQGDVQLYKISGGGGGGSYTDYTTVCQNCTLTGIALNTSGVKTTFVTNETFTSEGLVVTANYSDCDSKTVTPNSVSSPDMSTTGGKTVTVSYTEGEVTITNTYNITVVAPKTVTYMACGDVFTTQEYAPGATLVLPTETPGANEGMTFVGWTATEHYTDASAPALISAGSAVNANATYYAVFH